MSPLLEFLALHGRTDAVSVLPDPPVEPTRGRYTDMTSLSQFLGTAGSTDTLSVLLIIAAGLYKPGALRLGFQFLSLAAPSLSHCSILEGISKTNRAKCF
jgi:hypothetical protein